MIHLSRKDASVNSIIQATFPGFNGHGVKANISPTVLFWGTMWDSGNRRTYRILHLATMKQQPIPTEPFMREAPEYQKNWTIPEGCVVVVHVQCRDEHIEIITPTNNVTPALEQTIDLTDDEKIVLNATCSYKSSYGGVSNYRFVEAKRQTGITLDRWNMAKESLIAKKLLNKAGAATIEGRNARTNKPGGYLTDTTL
jgi:hypothetical protein